MKLGEIAKVSIGIVVNRENDDNGQFTYKLFSLKNYEENNKYEELKTNKDLSSKLAQEGDLLFRLIYPNKIIYVDKVIAGMAVPSQLCIIRPDRNIIDPVVLKWYLESESAKEQIKLHVSGSIIQTMPVSALKTIDIPEINMSTQKKIRELVNLWNEEKEISMKIIENKEQLYNRYIEEMIEYNIGD